MRACNGLPLNIFQTPPIIFVAISKRIKIISINGDDNKCEWPTAGSSITCRPVFYCYMMTTNYFTFSVIYMCDFDGQRRPRSVLLGLSVCAYPRVYVYNINHIYMHVCYTLVCPLNSEFTDIPSIACYTNNE